jgi:hypothetical protein
MSAAERPANGEFQAMSVASYMDLRTRGEGDVARTIEIVPGALMLDIDDEGRALGIEKISDRPIVLADLFAVVLAAHFGRGQAS